MAGVEDEGEVTALREALRQQTLAVEELKVELEEERHAASSGADEALAMILRLQAEKAAERMEAEQFRRVAEERILHDEDSLAFLKVVVFHQEMEISSLKHRLLAVCGSNDPYAAAATGADGAVELPWLRRLAKNGMSSKRDASVPAARLAELCSDLDAAGGGEDGYPCKNVRDRRPARTVSDIGEVIRREEWVRSNVNHHAPAPPRRLHRSASHRLRRAPSYSAQYGGVHDKFESHESVAEHVPLRSSRRASPEIISEEDDLISSARCGDRNPRNDFKNADHRTISELGADIEQIKGSMQNLETELTRMRETSMSRDDAQARLLTEICGKLDAMNKQQGVQGDKRCSPVKIRTNRREGSSSKGGSCPQRELLMNHFIEVCFIIFSALLVRPLLKVAASMSFFTCFLILVLAVVFIKVLIIS